MINDRMDYLETEARIEYLSNVIIKRAEEIINEEIKDPSKWHDKIISAQERVINKAIKELQELYQKMDDFRFDAMSKYEQEEYMLKKNLPFEGIF